MAKSKKRASDPTRIDPFDTDDSDVANRVIETPGKVAISSSTTKDLASRALSGAAGRHGVCPRLRIRTSARRQMAIRKMCSS
jgi:hypothetical protein